MAKLAGDCLALRSDVTKEEDVAETVKAIVAKWDQLVTVVNSAGVYRPGI